MKREKECLGGHWSAAPSTACVRKGQPALSQRLVEAHREQDGLPATGKGNIPRKELQYDYPPEVSQRWELGQRYKRCHRRLYHDDAFCAFVHIVSAIY